MGNCCVSRVKAEAKTDEEKALALSTHSHTVSFPQSLEGRGHRQKLRKPTIPKTRRSESGSIKVRKEARQISIDSSTLLDLRNFRPGFKETYEIIDTTGLMRVRHGLTKKEFWVQLWKAQDKLTDADLKAKLIAMRQLDHPNIIKLVDLLSDEENIYAIYEATRPCTVKILIQSQGGLDIKWAAQIMLQMFSAIRYCRSRGCHVTWLSFNRVFFIDTPSDELVWVKALLPVDDCIGEDLIYAAPEAKERTHSGPENVLWSCGILLSTLLIGEPIIQTQKDKSPNKLRQLYYKWESVEDGAKKLTLSLLSRSYQKRISVDDCLQHPWVQSALPRSALSPSLCAALRCMEVVKPTPVLKQELLLLMLNLVIPQEDLKNAQAAFRDLDADASGAISVNELKTQIERFYQEENAEKAFSTIQDAGFLWENDNMPYSEFMIWASAPVLLSDSNLHTLFALLDQNGNGRIALDELWGFIRTNVGGELHREAWKAMLAEVTGATKSVVGYEDFLSYMRKA